MESLTRQALSFDERLLGWWYRIAAPPEVADDAPLRDRMRVRSGRLTSVIFLIEIIFLVINLIVSILDAPIAAVVQIVIVLGVLIISVLLNRKGKTVAAGIVVITILTLGLVLDVVLTPGGLSPFMLSIIDFFSLTELIAASLLIPWMVLPITLFTCLITVGLITFLPKTPEMAQLLRMEPYSIYSDPLQIQITVAIVAFLWVSSTYREMNRANSAEEVGKLTMEIAMQQQAVQEEKQQLEESIQQIIEVHMQAANGNLNARVPLDKQNVLWSVAGSLNNLLARLQRWRYDAMKLQQNEQVLQQLLQNIHMARRQGQPFQAYTTGTSLDALIMEFSREMAVSHQVPSQPIRHQQSSES